MASPFGSECMTCAAVVVGAGRQAIDIQGDQIDLGGVAGSLWTASARRAPMAGADRRPRRGLSMWFRSNTPRGGVRGPGTTPPGDDLALAASDGGPPLLSQSWSSNVGHVASRTQNPPGSITQVAVELGHGPDLAAQPGPRRVCVSVSEPVVWVHAPADPASLGVSSRPVCHRKGVGARAKHSDFEGAGGASLIDHRRTAALVDDVEDLHGVP